MYLLKLAIRPWRLALLSQLFSATAVGFLLLLVGFLFWMHQGLRVVLVRLQGEQIVTAYLNPSETVEDEKRVLSAVQSILGPKGRVEVKLVDAPHFINLLKGQYPDLGRELEDLGDDMNQVVPRYVSIAGVLPDSVLEKIKNIPGIESAESSKDRYHQIVAAFSALRWVARVLIVGTCLALFTGLIHLSKMNAYLHRDSLFLLKFWGADHPQLITPGIVSGLLVGFLGGGIALGGWMVVGVSLTHRIRVLSSLLREMPSANWDLAIPLFIVGGVLGLLAGIAGSWSALHSKNEGGFRT